MSSDITGGYDPLMDYFLADRPEDPRMRDSASVWISDNAGRFGFPRMCIEIIASDWDDRGVQANIAFPDGRVLNGAGGFPGAPPKRVGDYSATINAGPLTFEVIEPFHHMTMTFDGAAYETTANAQFNGTTTGPEKQVTITVDAIMGAPPWTPGERARQSGNDAAAASMVIGGHRYEQLFTCTGRFAIAGEAEQTFSGTGLRIRRCGKRDTGDFPGHVWMSALFPSGRAFGLVAFPPRESGVAAYSEAFLFDGKAKRYGTVVEAPWLSRFEPHGGACGFVLQMDDGDRVTIGGKTHNSTFSGSGAPLFGNWAVGVGPQSTVTPFYQGDALFDWDGETAFGMVERSLPLAKWEDGYRPGETPR